jgi:hypothetical protein
MSDQITALFEQLRAAPPPAPFAPATAIRHRGQQRKHRRALAAGAAACTVVGLATGVPWLVDRDQGGSPPVGGTPTVPSPSPTAPVPASTRPAVGPGVPESLMLQPTEVGTGVRAGEIDDQGADGPDWRWGEIMSDCPSFRAADYPAQRQRTAARSLVYAAGGDVVAFEFVERFPAGRSDAAFEEGLELLARCPAFEAAERQERFTIVGRRLAGDDSVLVRRDTFFAAAPANTDYLVTVRVGAFVATVEATGATEDVARRLGQAAAARLG